MPEPGYAVVGGGIVGASVAYHVSERTNDPVVVYERGELAAETTFRATAMVGVAGPDPYHRMKAEGIRLYNEFFADPATEPRYRNAGRLRVATSADGAAELADIAGRVSARSGADGTVGDDAATDDAADGVAGDTDTTGVAMDGAAKYANSLVDYLPGEEIRERLLVPPLETGDVAGALHRPRYGYVGDDSRTLGPRELATEFVERARDNGATFETDTEVTDLRTEDGRVTGIEVDGQEVREVEAVVCAAGPWNRSVAAMAGIDLPVEHVRSPVFALALDEPLSYSLPMIKSHESGVGLHPKRDDVVLVTYTPDERERLSAAELAAVGDTPADEHRETALWWAERLLPVLGDADLADEWVGIGTSTPDGKPVVGWTAVDGLSLAATRAGIQYAPAVGSVVARQLVDGDPTEYYDAVSVSRFDGYTDGRSVENDQHPN